MNLIKRHFDPLDPFEMLTDLQSDLNHVFNRSLTNRHWAKAFDPNIEVKENADHFALHADLPGLKREDFTISVEGNSLTVKGERKQEKESNEPKKGYYYSERTYGSFSRSFEFPTEIQADKAKASYRDGVLEIVLPKSENAKPKQITVEVK